MENFQSGGRILTPVPAIPAGPSHNIPVTPLPGPGPGANIIAPGTSFTKIVNQEDYVPRPGTLPAPNPESVLVPIYPPLTRGGNRGDVSPFPADSPGGFGLRPEQNFNPVPPSSLIVRPSGRYPGQGENATPSNIEQFTGGVNVPPGLVEAWTSILEVGLRLGADIVTGPFQPYLQPIIYPWDVGNVAGTTTQLATIATVDGETFLGGFIGGQFNTSGVYVNNPSRWNVRLGDRYYFAVEHDGSTSTLVGVGEELFGNNLDHLAIFPTNYYIGRTQNVSLDVRNEGATQYNHRGILVCYARTPVEEDYLSMKWESQPRFFVFRSGSFTNNAGPAIVTFNSPVRIFGIRMHAEPTAGSVTTTAVRVRIRTSRRFDITKGVVVDQLMCGVTNQRTKVFTNPIYLPAGASVQVAWQNDLPTSPGALSHNVVLIGQLAKA